MYIRRRTYIGYNVATYTHIYHNPVSSYASAKTERYYKNQSKRKMVLLNDRRKKTIAYIDTETTN